MSDQLGAGPKFKSPAWVVGRERMRPESWGPPPASSSKLPSRSWESCPQGWHLRVGNGCRVCGEALCPWVLKDPGFAAHGHTHAQGLVSVRTAQSPCLSRDGSHARPPTLCTQSRDRRPPPCPQGSPGPPVSHQAPQTVPPPCPRPVAGPTPPSLPEADGSSRSPQHPRRLSACPAPGVRCLRNRTLSPPRAALTHGAHPAASELGRTPRGWFKAFAASPKPALTTLEALVHANPQQGRQLQGGVVSLEMTHVKALRAAPQRACRGLGRDWSQGDMGHRLQAGPALWAAIPSEGPSRRRYRRPGRARTEGAPLVLGTQLPPSLFRAGPPGRLVCTAAAEASPHSEYSPVCSGKPRHPPATLPSHHTLHL